MLILDNDCAINLACVDAVIYNDSSECVDVITKNYGVLKFPVRYKFFLIDELKKYYGIK